MLCGMLTHLLSCKLQDCCEWRGLRHAEPAQDDSIYGPLTDNLGGSWSCKQDQGRTLCKEAWDLTLE